MIHVICLNPAIDKVFEIDGFTAGEDYPGRRAHSAAGGKGVNVARVLTQLYAPATLYAFMGRDGDMLVRREMQERCPCNFIPVAGACRTTINIIDRENARETVITEGGPEVSEEDVGVLMRALEAGVRPGDIVCCSGSLPMGAPKDLYAQVSRLCREKGGRCVLDCNAATLPASLDGAHYALGKPNERELAAYLGCGRTNDAREVAKMARRLMPPYDALLVSMGAAGGVLVTKEGAWRASLPQREIVSTVGSGDSSVAGALFAMQEGAEAPEILRRAMACGLACAMGGQVGSISAWDYRQNYREIEIEPID